MLSLQDYLPNKSSFYNACDAFNKNATSVKEKTCDFFNSSKEIISSTKEYIKNASPKQLAIIGVSAATTSLAIALVANINLLSFEPKTNNETSSTNHNLSPSNATIPNKPLNLFDPNKFISNETNYSTNAIPVPKETPAPKLPSLNNTNTTSLPKELARPEIQKDPFSFCNRIPTQMPFQDNKGNSLSFSFTNQTILNENCRSIINQEIPENFCVDPKMKLDLGALLNPAKAIANEIKTNPENKKIYCDALSKLFSMKLVKPDNTNLGPLSFFMNKVVQYKVFLKEVEELCK